MSGNHIWRAPGALLLALLLLRAPANAPYRAAAQSSQPGIKLHNLGSVPVIGSDWSFSLDIGISAGAWESVTVSNYGYCFVGPNDPREGTAHAAGVFWFGELKPLGPGDGFFGTLEPGRGGNVKGTVTVTSPTAGTTHIEAALSGSDLNYFAE